MYSYKSTFTIYPRKIYYYSLLGATLVVSKTNKKYLVLGQLYHVPFKLTLRRSHVTANPLRVSHLLCISPTPENCQTFCRVSYESKEC